MTILVLPALSCVSCPVHRLKQLSASGVILRLLILLHDLFLALKDTIFTDLRHHPPPSCPRTISTMHPRKPHALERRVSALLCKTCCRDHTAPANTASCQRHADLQPSGSCQHHPSSSASCRLHTDTSYSNSSSFQYHHTDHQPPRSWVVLSTSA